MNIQPVRMREGQSLQCWQCWNMYSKVYANLDGPAFKVYYCQTCLDKLLLRKAE